MPLHLLLHLSTVKSAAVKRIVASQKDLGRNEEHDELAASQISQDRDA